MTVSPSQPAADDPVSTLLRSRGFMLRLIILVVALCAIFLPAYVGRAPIVGLVNSSSVLDRVPWAFILPVLVLAGLLSPAIAPVARYARLIDIVTAAFAVILATYFLSDIYRSFEAVAQHNRMVPDRSSQNRLYIALSAGSYSLYAAAALSVVQALRGR